MLHYQRCFLVRQMLDATAARRTGGWEYKLEAVMVEVYNEVLRDLLARAFTVKGCTSPA